MIMRELGGKWGKMSENGGWKDGKTERRRTGRWEDGKTGMGVTTKNAEWGAKDAEWGF